MASNILSNFIYFTNKHQVFIDKKLPVWENIFYYVTSSVRGQDEPKLMLWLATWAGKMELSCLLRIQALSLKENLFTFRCFIPYNKSSIDQACPVKMAAYWLHSFFCMFMDLDFISVHKHAKKQLGQYPAWLHTWSITHNYILYYKLNKYLLVPTGIS